MHTHDSNPTDPTAPRGPADLKTGSGIVRGLLGMATAWWLIGALLLWLVDRGLAKNIAYAEFRISDGMSTSGLC